MCVHQRPDVGHVRLAGKIDTSRRLVNFRNVSEEMSELLLRVATKRLLLNGTCDKNWPSIGRLTNP